MKKRAFLIAIAILAAHANARQTPDLKKALIGQWAQVSAPGFVEQVVVFREDHSFAMYPKCGRETEQLKKAGLSVFPGTWEIVGENTLRIGIQNGGKSATLDATVAVAGPEVRVTNAQGTTSAMVRYIGVLPPKCP